ncbi:hypothetical protein F4809DRAFT_263191 [Biscogniauxia mediterranea]|nr:hypothetical protein F4809DRAFT_263191 [Biscogniauxia mediterranea]
MSQPSVLWYPNSGLITKIQIISRLSLGYMFEWKLYIFHRNPASYSSISLLSLQAIMTRAWSITRDEIIPALQEALSDVFWIDVLRAIQCYVDFLIARYELRKGASTGGTAGTWALNTDHETLASKHKHSEGAYADTESWISRRDLIEPCKTLATTIYNELVHPILVGDDTSQTSQPKYPQLPNYYDQYYQPGAPYQDYQYYGGRFSFWSDQHNYLSR